MKHNSASRGRRTGLRGMATVAAVTAAATLGLTATTTPANAAVTGRVFHGFEMVFVNQNGHLDNVNPDITVESHGPILSTGGSTSGVGIAANLTNGTFQEVLRASDGSVYTGNNGGFSKLGIQTADPNSTPAIAFDSRGQRVVEFVQNGVVRFSGPVSLGGFDISAAPDTSPSVAALATPGTFVSAWVSRLGKLTWNTDISTGVGSQSSNAFTVQPGTSPVVSTSGSHWRIEARDARGTIWAVTDTDTTAQATAGVVIDPVGSPSLTGLSNGSFLDAFAGGATNDLFVGGGDTGLRVLRGTNPAIAGNGTGGWQVIYEGTDLREHTLDSAGRRTTLGVLPDTGISPQLTGLFSN